MFLFAQGELYFCFYISKFQEKQIKKNLKHKLITSENGVKSAAEHIRAHHISCENHGVSIGEPGGFYASHFVLSRVQQLVLSQNRQGKIQELRTLLLLASRVNIHRL